MTAGIQRTEITRSPRHPLSLGPSVQRSSRKKGLQRLRPPSGAGPQDWGGEGGGGQRDWEQPTFLARSRVWRGSGQNAVQATIAESGRHGVRWEKAMWAFGAERLAAGGGRVTHGLLVAGRRFCGGGTVFDARKDLIETHYISSLLSPAPPRSRSRRQVASSLANGCPCSGAPPPEDNPLVRSRGPRPLCPARPACPALPLARGQRCAGWATVQRTLPPHCSHVHVHHRWRAAGVDRLDSPTPQHLPTRGHGTWEKKNATAPSPAKWAFDIRQGPRSTRGRRDASRQRPDDGRRIFRAGPVPRRFPSASVPPSRSS